MTEQPPSLDESPDDIQTLLASFEQLDGDTSECDELRECTEQLVLLLARQLAAPDPVPDLDQHLLRFAEAMILRMTGIQSPYLSEGGEVPKRVIEPNRALGWIKPGHRPPHGVKKMTIDGLTACLGMKLIERKYPLLKRAQQKQKALRLLRINSMTVLNERLRLIDKEDGIWALMEVESMRTEELETILKNILSDRPC